MKRGLRAWLPIAAVAVLLAAVVVAADASQPRITNVPVTRPSLEWQAGAEPTPSTLPSESGTMPPDETGQMLPDWLTTLLGLLCVVVVVAVALTVTWYLLRDRIRLRPDTPEGDPVAVGMRTEEVRAALQAGIDDLAEGNDPRTAVIACWLRLEKAAAAAGTPRAATDTAADLVTRMLASHAVTEPVLDRFAEVYRQARYAPHVVDETMRDEARDALTRLRAELTGAAPASQREP